MHLFMRDECVNAWSPRKYRGRRFSGGEKNPHDGGFYLTAEGLTGVHAPPEDVTEDDDLLVLHFLERVVLVRMLIAVEAA